MLLAKAGLDGHDRGIKVIAMALRDAGMEVIYLGLRRTPEEIVEAALDEDVDVIGVSLLTGAHTVLFPRISALMKKKNLRAVLIGGGIIPDEDVPMLRKQGVSAIFTPGTATETIVKFIENAVKKRKDRGAPSKSAPRRTERVAALHAP